MITIIGIAHVIKIRKAIERMIEVSLPNIICVELDRQRYEALSKGELGADMPFLYRMLSNFQKNVAKKYGSSVGDEMLAAIDAARALKLPVAFIDVPSATGGKTILDSLTFKEKAGLILSAIGGMFVSKKRIERELEKFQEEPEKYLNAIGKKYPDIKKVLIDQRDEFMSMNILKLSKKYAHVLAVVGDGHVTGLARILKNEGLDVIRLETIRKMLDDEGNIIEKHARELGFPAISRDPDLNSSMSFDFTWGQE
ncbi:MAG: TraB/GumN family protein [Candidatus Thermoplasmatota archaeon]|nr:TraB/GumN family protein [Candidatus Thermoplasmatota archaeon]